MLPWEHLRHFILHSGCYSLPYIIAGYVFKNIKTRTKVLGYLTASWNGAAILGPLIGGWLIDAFSWHWVFYINIPIGLLAIIICLVYTSQLRLSKRQSLIFLVQHCLLSDCYYS